MIQTTITLKCHDLKRAQMLAMQFEAFVLRANRFGTETIKDKAGQDVATQLAGAISESIATVTEVTHKTVKD